MDLNKLTNMITIDATNALANIERKLRSALDFYNNINLPTIEAIAKTAKDFDGKVFNRRFTAAVTKALEGNPHEIRVDFETDSTGHTHYDWIEVVYYNEAKRNISVFGIYPQCYDVEDYTDNAGRLVADKLIAVCEYKKELALEYISEINAAIDRLPEFVRRVREAQDAINAINNDFPTFLRQYIKGDLTFVNF